MYVYVPLDYMIYVCGLLGHGVPISHISLSNSEPSHGLPPNRARGLSHVRDRVRLPVPHVTGHVDHSFQVDHPPWTGEETRNMHTQM